MYPERNKLGFFRLSEGVEVPKIATAGSAAFDLRLFLDGSPVEAFSDRNELVLIDVSNDGKLVVPAGWRVKLPTGLIFDIPQGFWLSVNVRGGTALKKGLILSNSTGIVDWDYTQELFMCMTNATSTIVVLEHNERLCQAMLRQCVPTEVEELMTPPSQKTERAGGFNSTGTKEIIIPGQLPGETLFLDGHDHPHN